MIRSYIILIYLLISGCTGLYAQQPKDDPASLSGKSAVFTSLHPWLYTDNAAGVSSITSSTGHTSLGVEGEDGDFRRPQQPARSNRILFQSERYQQLAKGFVYGSFRFTQQWDKSIRWSQLLNPYRGTPFILADSLGGDWTKQFYELNLKATTAKLANDRLTLGLGLVYQAGTGARQNDPRPLNTINELELTPSMIWELSPSHHIGLNGAYSIYKQEIETEVNNFTINQQRYMLTGLGTYLPVDYFGNPSVRNYKGDTYGGDIQYEWRNRRWAWLTSAGYRQRSESLIDGTDRPRRRGTLEEKEYKAFVSIRYNSGTLHHSLTARWNQYDREGIEEHQLFNTDPNVLKYETLVKTPLTGSLVTRAGFTYQLLKLHQQQDYKWSLEAGMFFRGLDNKYYFPVKSLQLADMADWSLAAKKNWSFKGKRNLEIGIHALYTSRIHAKEENNGSPVNNTIVAKEFFFPDQGYLSSEAWKASASLQYAFTLPQVAKTQFFIRANGFLQQQTGKEYFGVNGERKQFAFTLGAFY